MNHDAIKLFVIGNGFDLAHGLDTRYSDFKRFLGEKCNASTDLYENGTKGKLCNDCPELPIPQIHYCDKNNNGKVLADYEKEAAILYWLIEKAARHTKCGIKDWADFEEIIMKMDFKSLDINDKHAMSALRDTVTDLPGMFSEWVSKIVIDESLPLLANMCMVAETDVDIVLNFNYTETLERVYGFKPENICYIHGKRIQKPPKEYEQQYMWNFGEENKSLVVGGPEPKNPRKDPYIHIRGNLIKDTESTISTNEAFLNALR